MSQPDLDGLPDSGSPWQARSLRHADHPYHHAPRGRWLGVDQSTVWQYPCRCEPATPCGKRCPCAGRTDLEGLPSTCCARRAAETARRNRSGAA